MDEIGNKAIKNYFRDRLLYFRFGKYPQRRVIYCSEQSPIGLGNILFGSLFPGSVYILKDELKQIPILRGYFNRLGFIFVERNKTFKSLKTVLRSARRLTKNQKKVFVIFPEGTRLSPGETGKINPGFFAIHKFLKIPILPIKLNSGDHWINKKFSKKSGTINVKIFPLIKNVSSKEKIVDILKKSFY